MSKPSSFCTICTSNCAYELFGLLLSLSLYHKNETIYIMADTKTKQYIEESTPTPNLNIKWFIELDKYNNMNRAIMEQKGIFGNFLKNKMKIIKYALQEGIPDTMFLDSDIVILDIIDNIDITKNVGLSPQFIKKEYLDKTGFYNAGVFWCNSIDIVNFWENIINHNNHCPEQINMYKLQKFKYFEFGENYNLQCWRFYLSDSSKNEISKNITSKINDILYYKNKPLKFIHTHFLDSRFNEFNDIIISHLKNAKLYKLLLIIYRIINNKWILRIPKQPLNGLGYHKNDSYRELPLLMKLKNKDVDVKFDDKTIHCWIEPNILTYDRPTLEWCNQEIVQSSLLLLGNGDINTEGKQLKNSIPNINIKPWIFWPRKPMLLEKILKEKSILSYSERTINSIFIGNFENSVQAKYRKNNISWGEVITEFHCTKGNQHKFTHEEYLLKLRETKYGLCLRGYGSKCHREVELMAFGTVPIVTPEVSIKSYMNPLIENEHYIFVSSPEELQKKIENIDEEQWKIMSNNCFEWYQKNVHSNNCWKNMIDFILFDN